MNKIFVGGSRHVSRLPTEVKKRLDNVIASGHQVIVGDANGADKAVQKHLLDKHYDNVTVFCSGDKPRNNLGTWMTHHVDVPKNAKGFHFYAAKDREMAREADFGLMIWDGKSPGTVLNVLRLALAGKIAVLFNVPEKDVRNIKDVAHWKTLISQYSHEFQLDVKERATPEEWQSVEDNQFDLLSTIEKNAELERETKEIKSTEREPTYSIDDDTLAQLNNALANGDLSVVIERLSALAHKKNISCVAPEFAAVIKAMSEVGLQLEAKKKRIE